jgi:hypothetical protein
MTAYNVNVPVTWKFDGIYAAGTSCSEIPFPVFRAYSPDGLTELRRFPRLDWSWSNSKFKGAPHPDCLNLQQELSAQEFLKYIMGVLQVAYVRDAPIQQQLIDAQQKQIDQSNAALAANAARLDQMNASMRVTARMPKVQPAVQHAELAAAYAQYRNGSFMIEEHLFVRLLCTRTPMNLVAEPGSFGETCNATVRVVRAPQGKLAGVLAQIEAQNLGASENPAWVSRYMQGMADQARAASNQMFRASNALMQQRHADFERGQALRAQQHQQFMATMREGTDRALARAQAAADSRHAVAQDWCDFLLDRQTVTGSGGTVKISNAYNHTWTDGSGQYYQTNDPNANPNGVLSGNWTMTTQVHGDGSPK